MMSKKDRSDEEQYITNSDFIDKELKNISGYLGCMSYEDLARTKVSDKYCAVVNLDDTIGTHWVVVYKDPKNCFLEYYDSFGMPPPDILINWSNVPIYYQKYQLQKDKSDKCGYFAIYFIKNRAKGREIDDILNDFTHRPSLHNEDLVLRD